MNERMIERAIERTNERMNEQKLKLESALVSHVKLFLIIFPACHNFDTGMSKTPQQIQT